MKQKFISILIVFISFVFFHCKKEHDSIPPRIIISSPVNNQHFSVIDTIVIKGQVEDENIIETVSIVIVNDDMIPVMQKVSINVNSKKTGLNETYIINNIHLSSDYYYLQISAGDGNNITKSFIKLYLSSIPKERTGIFIISKQTDNSTQIFRLDTAGSLIYQFTFDDKFQDAAISSYFQQLYILGKNDGNMKAYNLPSNQVCWEVNNINNVLYTFKGRVGVIAQLIFVSFSSGSIKGFDNYGTVRQVADISNELFHPTIFYKHYDYLLVEAEPTDNQDNRIEKIYYSTGSPLHYHSVDFQVINFFSYDEDKVLIWSVKNEKAKVYTLSCSYNILDEIISLPDEKLHSVIQVEDKVFLAAMGNHIYKFKAETNSLSIFKENFYTNKLKYDELNNEIFAMNNKNLSIMLYPSANITYSLAHSDTIADVEFLYNR